MALVIYMKLTLAVVFCFFLVCLTNRCSLAVREQLLVVGGVFQHAFWFHWKWQATQRAQSTHYIQHTASIQPAYSRHVEERQNRATQAVIIPLFSSTQQHISRCTSRHDIKSSCSLYPYQIWTDGYFQEQLTALTKTDDHGDPPQLKNRQTDIHTGIKTWLPWPNDRRSAGPSIAQDIGG